MKGASHDQEPRHLPSGGPPLVPGLTARPALPPHEGFVFEAFDVNGEAEIRTLHATFADALSQIVLRMRVEGPAIQWEVHQGS